MPRITPPNWKTLRSKLIPDKARPSNICPWHKTANCQTTEKQKNISAVVKTNACDNYCCFPTRTTVLWWLAVFDVFSLALFTQHVGHRFWKLLIHVMLPIWSVKQLPGIIKGQIELCTALFPFQDTQQQQQQISKWVSESG